MILYTPPTVTDTLPVIDMRAWLDGSSRPGIAAALHAHAQKCGFFYLANHGIPEALTDAVLEQTRRLFALPKEELLRLDFADSPCRRGYEPMSSQVLDAGSAPDLKESFLMGSDPGPEHPYVRDRVPGYGPNRWPPADAGGLAQFRETLEAYYAQVNVLAQELMAMLALAMRAPADYFAPAYQDPIATLRLVHYPPQPVKAAFNQIGCGAHTDWGAVTLLLQDETGGLEVCDAAGTWIAAQPMPGTLLVNLGDMVPRWTNGLYHSNLHRVKNTHPDRHRYSVPFFYDLNYFARVECMPQAMPATGAALYPPCTVGEHIEEMYRKTFSANAAPLARA